MFIPFLDDKERDSVSPALPDSVQLPTIRAVRGGLRQQFSPPPPGHRLVTAASGVCFRAGVKINAAPLKLQARGAEGTRAAALKASALVQHANHLGFHLRWGAIRTVG